MIRGLIDFALRNRILVLSVTLVLFIWGVWSFHNLPIEAYPDVADTYTQIITQWPGHAAEEVEQQITVPLEVQLNGVPHKTHLRSVSLAGRLLGCASVSTCSVGRAALSRAPLLRRLLAAVKVSAGWYRYRDRRTHPSP